MRVDAPLGAPLREDPLPGAEGPRGAHLLDVVGAASLELFDGIINPKLLSRRINITACNVIPESELEHMQEPDEQLNLLVDYEELEEKRAEEDAELAAERRRQEAILSARRRFGKNAVLKGMNLQEGATQKDRNRQIGGHRA